MPDLRTQIATLMTREGVTQAELSRRSGIPQGTISRWLSGDMAITVPRAEKLAAAMGKRIVLRRD